MPRPLRGYRADRGGMSYASVETLAVRVRKYLAPDLQPDERLPGISLFEGLHERAIRVSPGHVIPLTWGIKELSPGVMGRTRYLVETGQISIELSPESYDALERDLCRPRHTVFHETSHAFVHTEQLMRLSQIPHAEMAMSRGRTDHRHFEDTEWQADAGSAALLMPALGLEALEQRGMLSVREVSNHFNVSAESAGYRLDVYETYLRRELPSLKLRQQEVLRKNS